MTLEQFNSLGPKEKEIATIDGKFIAERQEAGVKVALYSVGKIWVEVWYDGDRNDVIFLIGFRSLERLGPYLSDLELKIDLGQN